jgi:hypothetical protein
MPRQTALPPTLAPRLVSREAAAAYVCVSPNTFDENGQGRPDPRVKTSHVASGDVVLANKIETAKPHEAVIAAG